MGEGDNDSICEQEQLIGLYSNSATESKFLLFIYYIFQIIINYLNFE